MRRAWGCAPRTKVYRIGAKTWQGRVKARRGPPVRETPGHVSAAGRALGLLLSRALSSRLPRFDYRPIGERVSSARLVQQVVDGEVLLDQARLHAKA